MAAAANYDSVGGKGVSIALRLAAPAVPDIPSPVYWSRCTVSGENAGTHMAMYSAPWGVL